MRDHFVMVLGFLVFLLVASPASAVHDAGLLELDGNIVHDAGTDWSDLFSAGNPGGVPLPLPPYAIASAFVHDAFAVGAGGGHDGDTADPSNFATGSKDTLDISGWACTAVNNPTPKDDIQHTYGVVFQPTTGTYAGHTLIYLAMERFGNEGDADVGFWILQDSSVSCTSGAFTGAHVVGDLLIVAEFTNGGVIVTLNVYEWVGGSDPLTLVATGTDCSSAGSGDTVCAEVNTGPIPTPWRNRVKENGTPDNTLGISEFFELGIDVSAIFATPPCYANVIADTRTSTSLTATLKDFAQIGLPSCKGHIKVDKVTDPSGDATSFNFTTTGSGYNSFSLKDTDAPNDQTLMPGAYSVTETVPSDWALTGLTCSSTGSHSYWTIESPKVSINLAAGETVTCTFTDRKKNSPSISTTLSATSPISIGDTVYDSASLTGATSNAGGTVTYSVYSGGNCSGGALDSDTVTVTNGNVPNSKVFNVFTSAGTYSFQAVYSGDPNNNGASSVCSTELLTVEKNSPSISTTLSATSVPIGTPVTDSATLSGVTSDAAGNIIFKVFSGTDTTCSGTVPFTSNTITVNGPNTYGPSQPNFIPSSVGTYRWQAFYSGDAKNNPATSSCDAEILTVNQATPSIVTLVSSSLITLGGSASDTATLSGGVNPTGTITFTAYGPSDTASCSGTAVFTSVVTVNHGNGDYTSGAFTPSAAGKYWWVASYSGDGNNNAVSTGCGDSGETLVVNKVGPSIVTLLSALQVTIGTPVTDTATLSGGTNPTGTITFYVYPAGDSSCSLSPIETFTVSVDHGNGDYTSPAFTPAAVGVYQWVASYSGDDNNEPASSDCGEESLEVGGSVGTISTTLSASEVTVGTPVTDSATLSGVTGDAGGNIVFKVFSGSDTDCSGTALFTSNTISVSGPGVYGPSTPSFTPTSVGTFRWQAFYSGDPNNDPVASACDLEILTVNQATPSIVTLLSASEVTIGTPVTDTATLSGGHSPTGTITFNVYPAGDSLCQLAPIFTSVVTVNGNGQYTSAAFTPTSVGVYQWVASYSGDDNNKAASSNCGDEPLEVGGGQGRIWTVLSASVITLGQSVHDSAFLSGVTPDAGGTVTYYVYDDPFCSEGHIVFTSIKTVTNGIVPDSEPFTPTAVGIYQWLASYSGDAKNAPAVDACGNEPLEVRSGDGQQQPPVGGDVYGSNKLVLLKPYLALLGLLGVVAAGVAITRGRRP